MLNASPPLGVNVPAGYLDLFATQSSPSSPVTNLLVSIADAVVAAQVDAVRDEAQKFADSKAVPMRSLKNVNEIARDFRMVVPADGMLALSDLINAGWILFHDKRLWENVPQIKANDRNRILYDLILKSLRGRRIQGKGELPMMLRATKSLNNFRRLIIPTIR